MLSNLIQSFCGPILLLVSFFINAPLKAQKAPDRLKTIQQRQALESKSVLNPIKFRNIGPSVMSGRVVDVEGNPDDPTEFYVAYATGGLWHTTNNGQSFVPIFDSADVITIGDIAVNWKTRTIWVGTGEVNSSRSSYAGMGIFKSKDNGKTWQYLGLPESQHIGKIQLHPTDDNIAWVAVLGHLYTPNRERGVYKTTDGGVTWKQTLYIDDNTGVVDLDINSQNPNEVYAAAWYRTRSAWNFEESGKTSGIYKSNDGGNTWALITKQGAGFPVGEGVGRIGLAVYPKNPQVVYAIMDNNFHKAATEKKTDSVSYVLRDFEKLTKEQFMQLDPKKLDTFLRRNRMYPKYNAEMIMERVSNGTLKPTVIWEYLYDANTALFDTPITGAEIYRSDNGGQSWKKTNTKDLTLYNTYGYYFGKIFISPYNDQKLVITGFDIELSTDGGKTFSRIDKENVHADHHVAWIDPRRDNHFIIGNDGGCNITYDNGDHWFKANTPSVGQFYSVFVDNAKPYNVYGGLQDNGVWYGPSNNRENVGWQDGGNYAFKSIAGGDGMQVQVDTRDNATTYTGFQFGNYARLNRLNPRETSKRITPQHPLGERPFRFNWQTPVLISKHNQDVIYFGGNKLFRSFNRADTLIAISNDLTNGGKAGDVPFGTITTIAESPLRFGLLYVGTDDGNIQLTKDGGSTWTLVNAAAAKKGQTTVLPQGLWVSRLTASQYKESRVYATLNGYRNDDFNSYVYVSEDYGTTWTVLGRDLPAEPVNVIKEDPKNENILYLGTDGGLYVSFDRGQSFMMWNGGLPKSIPVHDIAIQERDNEIVLGTHGRSIYVSSLEDVQGLQKDKDWLKKKPAPKEQPERRFRSDD
ncbi:MAG: WD40/YVTN/BNR-like repeat-containing protein [Flavisolibacter sp.]